jgi:putative oxidoreductase
MSRPAYLDRPTTSEPAPRVWERPRLAEAAYIVLRVGTGVLFLGHGLQKLFGLFGGQPVPLDSLLGVAGLLELVGGALLALGLLTRPVAIVLALEMIAAYVMAHLPRSVWPLENGGETALLFALLFVFFALTPRVRAPR